MTTQDHHGIADSAARDAYWRGFRGERDRELNTRLDLEAAFERVSKDVPGEVGRAVERYTAADLFAGRHLETARTEDGHPAASGTPRTVVEESYREQLHDAYLLFAKEADGAGSQARWQAVHDALREQAPVHVERIATRRRALDLFAGEFDAAVRDFRGQDVFGGRYLPEGGDDVAGALHRDPVALADRLRHPLPDDMPATLADVRLRAMLDHARAVDTAFAERIRHETARAVHTALGRSDSGAAEPGSSAAGRGRAADPFADDSVRELRASLDRQVRELSERERLAGRALGVLDRELDVPDDDLRGRYAPQEARDWARESFRKDLRSAFARIHAGPDGPAEDRAAAWERHVEQATTAEAIAARLAYAEYRHLRMAEAERAFEQARTDFQRSHTLTPLSETQRDRVHEEWTKVAEQAVEDHWFGHLARPDFRSPGPGEDGLRTPDPRPFDEALPRLRDTLPARFTHETDLEHVLSEAGKDFHTLVGHPDSRFSHRHSVRDTTLDSLGKAFRGETVAAYDRAWSPAAHDITAWLAHEARHENLFAETLTAHAATPLAPREPDVPPAPAPHPADPATPPAPAGTRADDRTDGIPTTASGQIQEQLPEPARTADQPVLDEQRHDPADRTPGAADAEQLQQQTLAVAERPRQREHPEIAEAPPLRIPSAPRQGVHPGPPLHAGPRFDARRVVERDGIERTELTVKVAFTAGTDETAAAGVLERTRTGVSRLFHGRGLYSHAGRLHITVRRVQPDQHPHLTVDLAAHDDLAPRHAWPQNAEPEHYARLIGLHTGLLNPAAAGSSVIPVHWQTFERQALAPVTDHPFLIRESVTGDGTPAIQVHLMVEAPDITGQFPSARDALHARVRDSVTADAGPLLDALSAGRATALSVHFVPPGRGALVQLTNDASTGAWQVRTSTEELVSRLSDALGHRPAPDDGADLTKPGPGALGRLLHQPLRTVGERIARDVADGGAAVEPARSSGEIRVGPVTTPYDAWNAFAEADPRRAEEVLTATRSGFAADLGDMDDAVRRAYTALTVKDHGRSVVDQAQLLVNQVLTGGRYVVEGGAWGLEAELTAFDLVLPPGPELPSTLLVSPTMQVAMEETSGAPFVELVSPPLAAVQGDNGRPATQQFFDHFQTVWNRLNRLPLGRSVALLEVFPPAEGFRVHHQVQNQQQVINAGIVRQERGPQISPQYTVGVPVSALHEFLVHVHDRSDNAHHVLSALRAGLRFGNDAARSYTALLRQVDFRRLPPQTADLLPGDEDVNALRGFLGLVYTQASGRVYFGAQRRYVQLRDEDVPLEKNLVAVLSRVPMGRIRASLPPNVQGFLQNHAAWLKQEFTRRVRQSLLDDEAYGQVFRNRGVESFPLLAVPIDDTGTITVEHYLDSALSGHAPVVTQNQAFGGLSELTAPDSNQGFLNPPLVPLELRFYGEDSLSFPEVRDTSLALVGVKQALHQSALWRAARNRDRVESEWRSLHGLLTGTQQAATRFVAFLHSTGALAEVLPQDQDRLLPGPPETVSSLATAAIDVQYFESNRAYRFDQPRLESATGTLSSLITTLDNLSRVLGPQVRPHLQQARAATVQLHDSFRGALAAAQQSAGASSHRPRRIWEEGPRSSARAVDVSVVSDDRMGRDARWQEARAAAVPTEVSRTWIRPVGPDAPYTVDSRFTVRRLRHEGRPVTDLTVRVGIGESHDLAPEQITEVRERAREGAAYLSTADIVPELPDGSRVHVTLLFTDDPDHPLPPHDQGPPHLTVALGPDTGLPMTLTRWQPEAAPIRYAHEIAHQLGLRDSSGIPGTLMGDFGQDLETDWAENGLTANTLRPRDVQLLHQLIGPHPDTVTTAATGTDTTTTTTATHRPTVHEPGVGPLPDALAAGYSTDLAADVVRPGRDALIQLTNDAWHLRTPTGELASRLAAALGHRPSPDDGTDAPSEALKDPTRAAREGQVPGDAHQTARGLFPNAVSAGAPTPEGDDTHAGDDRSTGSGQPSTSAVAPVRVPDAPRWLLDETNAELRRLKWPGGAADLGTVLGHRNTYTSAQLLHQPVRHIGARIARAIANGGTEAELLGGSPASRRNDERRSGPSTPYGSSGQRSATRGGAPGPVAGPSQSHGGAPAAYQRAEELTADLQRALVPVTVPQFLPPGPLGPDLFGLRRAPGVPAVLRNQAGVPYDYSGLSVDAKVEFLRRVDMVARTSAQGMDPQGWQVPQRRFSHSRVLSTTQWHSGGARRRVDPLPFTTLEMPRLVHAIWLGGPLNTADAPRFWERYGNDALRFRNEATFVLWTDVPRAEIGNALAGHRGPAGSRAAKVFDLVQWAGRAGIGLLNVDEVFNASRPMRLNDAFRTELAKQTGPGWAAASDLLRVAVVKEFGGLYSDGDHVIDSLADLHDIGQGARQDTYAVYSEFVPQTQNYNIANGVLLAPAGHPVLTMLEDTHLRNYEKTQRQLYQPFSNAIQAGRVDMSTHRYSVMFRTGPNTFTDLFVDLGYVNTVRVPSVQHITMSFEGSWRAAVPPVSVAENWPKDRTHALARNLVHTAVRGLHNRDGDLHLTQLDKAIRKSGHPDRDLLWRSVFQFLRSRNDLAGRVRTVTPTSWNDSTGRWETVELPPDVAAMIQYQQAPVDQWLAEHVYQARLAAPAPAQGQGRRPGLAGGAPAADRGADPGWDTAAAGPSAGVREPSVEAGPEAVDVPPEGGLAERFDALADAPASERGTAIREETAANLHREGSAGVLIGNDAETVLARQRRALRLPTSAEDREPGQERRRELLDPLHALHTVFETAVTAPPVTNSGEDPAAVQTADSDTTERAERAGRPPWYADHGMLGVHTLRGAVGWSRDEAGGHARAIAAELADRDLARAVEPHLAELLTAQGPAAWHSLLAGGRMVPLDGRVVWLRPVLHNFRPAEAPPAADQVRDYKVRYAATFVQNSESRTTTRTADTLLFTALNLKTAVASAFVGTPVIAGQAARITNTKVKQDVVSGRKIFVADINAFDADLRVQIFVDGRRSDPESRYSVPRAMTVEFPDAYSQPDEPVVALTGEPLATPADATVSASSPRAERGPLPRPAGEVVNALDTGPVVAALQRALRAQDVTPRITAEVVREAAKLLNESTLLNRSRWSFTSGDLSNPIVRGLDLPGLDGFDGHFRLRTDIAGLQLIGFAPARTRQDLGVGLGRLDGHGGKSAITYSVLANVSGLNVPTLSERVRAFAPLAGLGLGTGRKWGHTLTSQPLSHAILNTDTMQARYRARVRVSLEWTSRSHPRLSTVDALTDADISVPWRDGAGAREFEEHVLGEVRSPALRDAGPVVERGPVAAQPYVRALLREAGIAPRRTEVRPARLDAPAAELADRARRLPTAEPPALARRRGLGYAVAAALPGAALVEEHFRSAVRDVAGRDRGVPWALVDRQLSSYFGQPALEGELHN
ncbi:hypothetical protein ACFV23_25690, partial [Streptomyces sp. NPDC059627]